MTNNFYGECDRMIREKYFPDYGFIGTMVELGAGPETAFSLSKHFRENGWRIVLVEPNPKFVAAHRAAGHEIFNYACSDDQFENGTFEIAEEGLWNNEVIEGVSYSAIQLKQSYLDKGKGGQRGFRSVTTVNVPIKRLNTVLEEAKVYNVDLLCVDVEGWELNVMKGFSLNAYNPKVVVLENWTNDPSYTTYMEKFGYKLDSVWDHNHAYIRV